MCTCTVLAFLWSKVIILMEYQGHFEWATSDHWQLWARELCQLMHVPSRIFVGYINHNAHSFSPFQLYHYHRSLYCLWTGLLCCHYCCWSYCCGRVVWKIRRIIILPDEDGGERLWVLSYSLAFHFEHLMLKSVQSFQWQLQLFKYKSYKRLAARWSHTEHNQWH